MTNEINIRLFAENKSFRGPGKVFRNLKKGLDLLEGANLLSEYVSNDPPNLYFGILQASLEMELFPTKKTLFGPNLVVLPTENKFLFDSGDRHFVVPSQWVKDLYVGYDFVRQDNIHVWAVGIDTDTWAPTPSLKGSRVEALLYVKDRSEQDQRLVEKLLQKFDIAFRVIEYGKYLEEELKEACEECDFAILLTGTESQGIAYMQILSHGLPCYVFNKTTWKYQDVIVTATSVPYFDKRCGEVVDDLNIEHFREFYLNHEKYDPRSYILENHTLKLGAEKYIQIMKEHLQ